MTVFGKCMHVAVLVQRSQTLFLSFQKLKRVLPTVFNLYYLLIWS